MEFVALTSIREYWNNDAPQYFLGPWCKFPEHIFDDSLQDVVVLNSPWDDELKFGEAYRYSLVVTNKVVRFISELLTANAADKRGTRYWNILLWNWTNNFVSEILDRYTRIKLARSMVPDFRTRGIEPTTIRSTQCNFATLDSCRSTSRQTK